MFFFVFFFLGGGGITRNTLFTHGLSSAHSAVEDDSILSRSQSSNSNRSSASGRSRQGDDARSGSRRDSDGLAPSMQWTQEGT